MKVYLDNCCFNRPFDDQRQTRIRIEAEAKLDIQSRILTSELELVWSYIVDYENEANPFEDRKEAIRAWRAHAVANVEETPGILSAAEQLVALGLKSKDALHVACAISAECKCFLTTDDEILKRADDVRDVEILDPTDLLRRLTP